jgi:hypothetical protein
MVSLKVGEDTNGIKGDFIKDSLSKGKEMDMEYGLIKMEINTKENSKMIANMAKADKFTRMAKNIKEYSRMGPE